MIRGCLLCSDEIDERRVGANPLVSYCLSCQQERETNNTFVKSRMEIGQEINGWQFEGLKTTIIKGELV